MALFLELWRRKVFVLLLTAIVGGGTFYGLQYVPDRYEAKGTLLLKLGREFLYRPEIDGAQPQRMFRLAEMINSESEILESRDLARAVVDELRPAVLYPALAQEVPLSEPLLERATEVFMDHLTVRSVKDSSIIKVGFEHGDAELAAEAVNLLLERFLSRHTELFGDDRTPYLEARVVDVRAALEGAGVALKDFQEEHDLVSATHQVELLLGRRGQLEDERVAARERVALVEEAIAAFAPPADGDSGPDDARTGPIARLDLGDAVDEALAERMRLLLQRGQDGANFSDDSRRMEATHDGLDAVDRFLRDALGSEHRSLTARLEALDAEVETLESRVHELGALAREEAVLQQRVALQHQQLADVEERLAAAQLARSLDEQGQISVKIVDRAAVPQRPSGLSRKMRLAVGTLAGLAFAVALVLAQAALRASAA